MVFKFSFSFASLIPAGFTTNFRYKLSSKTRVKLLLKQSYTIFAWLYYITQFAECSKLRFWTLPVKRQNFTLTRAPMAHKNWSKEQYKTRVFFFVVSIQTEVSKFSRITSNAVLFFLLNAKKAFSAFETNLFFLRGFSLFYYFNDLTFLNYFAYRTYLI